MYLFLINLADRENCFSACGEAIGVGSGKAENNYALYLKDSEIFFTDLKKYSEAWQLNSRLIDSDVVDNEELADASYRLSLAIYMSEDGN